MEQRTMNHEGHDISFSYSASDILAIDEQYAKQMLEYGKRSRCPSLRLLLSILMLSKTGQIELRYKNELFALEGRENV